MSFLWLKQLNYYQVVSTELCFRKRSCLKDLLLILALRSHIFLIPVQIWFLQRGSLIIAVTQSSVNICIMLILERAHFDIHMSITSCIIQRLAGQSIPMFLLLIYACGIC